MYLMVRFHTDRWAPTREPASRIKAVLDVDIEFVIGNLTERCQERVEYGSCKHGNVTWHWSWYGSKCYATCWSRSKDERVDARGAVVIVEVLSNKTPKVQQDNDITEYKDARDESHFCRACFLNILSMLFSKSFLLYGATYTLMRRFVSMFRTQMIGTAFI